MYTPAATTEPNSPLEPNPAAASPGHCAAQAAGVSGSGNYCVALFTLTQKIGLPGYDKTTAPGDALDVTARSSRPATW